jgi:hypothetical protein
MFLRTVRIHVKYYTASQTGTRQPVHSRREDVNNLFWDIFSTVNSESLKVQHLTTLSLKYKLVHFGLYRFDTSRKGKTQIRVFENRALRRTFGSYRHILTRSMTTQ